jgi:hypothetical protein
LLKPVSGYRQAGTGLKRLGKKLAAPVSKAKTVMTDDDAIDAASKGVSPESLFVVDRGGNENNRELMEASNMIHSVFERDFHHLEDVITGQEGSAAHWLEPWEAEAADEFDEQAVVEELNWSESVVSAAREIFAKKDRMASYRLFLQSDPLASSSEKLGRLARMNRKLKRDVGNMMSQDVSQDPSLVPNVENVQREARFFLEESNDEQHLDREAISFERALRAARVSLEKEGKFRQNKIDVLARRLEQIGDTPRKLQVSGLRGDAAIANGVYCADGLRQFWGRPLYQQIVSGGGAATHHYCYFDMRHDGSGGTHTWSDGTWIVGPTLNSDRCTCWLAEGNNSYRYPTPTDQLEEILADSGGKDRRGTIKAEGQDEAEVDDNDDGSDELGRWQVFDTIHKTWSPAPGTHCPAFEVSIVQERGQTMREYVQKAIDHEEMMLRRAQAALEGTSKFGEGLEVTLAAHKNIDGKMLREAFTMWRTQYYLEEIENSRNKLRRRILSRSRELQLSTDSDTRRETVDEILNAFTWACSRKIQARKMDKRRFAARIERPSVSRAFFSWKLAWRQSSASSMNTGGTFAEPVLPWNVRHPRSRFTNIWEAVQVILLVYVSFNVIWRVSFNTEPEGFWWYLETGIDMYFAVDVLLNFHTAFYDRSGDLQGLHPAGRVRGFWNILAFGSGADVKRLYSNYARGWMTIDIASIFPWGTFMNVLSGRADENDATGDTTEQARVVKVLRLLRLTKLLRLVRAMRILKKYEDHLGPILSASVLIGTVFLAIHTITCCWYFVGTFGTLSNTINGTEIVAGKASTGWVEAIFKGSERLCACYGDPDHPLYAFETEGGEDRTYFFDALDSVCVHPFDNSAPIELVCPEQRKMVPTSWDYYYKSMFTALKDNSIMSGYAHSVAELMCAALIAGVLGFMWGAVAGAWSSIFQANQMAGQRFNEKMAHLKEFCRIKGLDWGTRAKLVAHYEHLYPEQVIIDEVEIIDELPPGMRVDLVKQIYGSVIASVPLFFGLNSSILTEICMALMPLPALKGEVLLHEGATGTEMYCISDGSCRVTQHMRGGSDEERVRIWVEEVFAAHYSLIKLYEPNQKMLLEKLLKRMKVIARRSPNGDTVTYRELVNDQKISVMLESPRALMEAKATLNTLLALAKKQERVSYKGTLRLPDTIIGGSSPRGNAGGPVIKLLSLPKEVTAAIRWETALELMCSALQDGVTLCRMLNFFLDARKLDVWTEGGLADTAAGLAGDTVDIAANVVSGTASTAVAMADKTVSMIPNAMGSKQLQKGVSTVGAVQDATLGKSARVASGGSNKLSRSAGAKRNVTAFLEALQDPNRTFNTGDMITTAMSTGGQAGQHLFSVDDLLEYNKGTLQEQEQKQKRVCACLLELGVVVSNLPGYMGGKWPSS